ncbi:MAG: CopD family protein [Candidatus Nitrospinota bacterium M3_3B_026]
MIALSAAVLLLAPLPAAATPEYAERTGKDCAACHVTPEGRALNETGLAYQAAGYRWPGDKRYEPIMPMGATARAVTGLVHFIGGFLWFGTILYVHILLRPAYAAKGLPKGEMRLGLFSMIAVGISGILLTLSRIDGADILYGTRWGILLSVKILIYTVMVTSAAMVVTLLNPRLRKGRAKAAHPKDGVFGPGTLGAFDGKGGAPAYIAFKGKVYDVTASKLWKDGEHLRKHAAGRDLTSELEGAPHGPEKLEAMEKAGTYDPSLPSHLTPPQRTFYVVAYTNLALVFVALAVIAFWRWGG